MNTRQIVIDYLPWFMSVITIYMTYIAGNKNAFAWLLGLGNQAFWLTWIVVSKNWGLLPMCVVLTGLYTRNYVKWLKPQQVS